MKKLILILLCLPLLTLAQQTYVPDANFENYLEINGMGNGILNDDSILTANINTVTSLDVSNQKISDLTGIEDFTALTYLACYYNQLTSLDVSANTALTILECFSNQLTVLDVRSGNNMNFDLFIAKENPHLYCIKVDDVALSTANWTVTNGNIDTQHYFSANCK
tara:strand:+ start:56 stop:550 length:495 start_codon:yes stop_codon:yes gene_type:complete